VSFEAGALALVIADRQAAVELVPTNSSKGASKVVLVEDIPTGHVQGIKQCNNQHHPWLPMVYKGSVAGQSNSREAVQCRLSMPKHTLKEGL
jgi:hypothetical protein